MPYIIINKDDNEDMRSQMRQQMRNASGIRSMNMRGHDSEIERAYRDGYEHGWKDHEREMDENESMMSNRRRRSGNGQFM